MKVAIMQERCLPLWFRKFGFKYRWASSDRALLGEKSGQNLSGQNICSGFTRNISSIEGTIVWPVDISVHTASDIILFAIKKHRLCWTQGGWTCVNCRPVIHNNYRQLVTFVILTLKKDRFCVHWSILHTHGCLKTASSMGPNDHLVHLTCFNMRYDMLYFTAAICHEFRHN